MPGWQETEAVFGECLVQEEESVCREGEAGMRTRVGDRAEAHRPQRRCSPARHAHACRRGATLGEPLRGCGQESWWEGEEG